MLSRRSILSFPALPVLRIQGQGSDMFGDAKAYERFMGRWSRVLAPLLVDFASPPDTGRILDVGSGTGSLAFAIAERKPRSRIVGIDPSKQYVAYANSRNPFPDRASFQVGDAQELSFRDKSFRASLSLLVFNFIPDPRKALREVSRVTEPGGTIAAATWDYDAGMRMLRVFWDAAASMDSRAGKLDERHMPLCRAGELPELWKQSGLENIEERPLDITMQFASFGDYWEAFLLGQGPAGAYVRSLEQHRRQRLRSAVKQRLPLPARDGPFNLPARAWSVRGTVPMGL
jgi:SAM-dependent methyltransferase